MNKIVMVTGGAGFIGSHLCDKYLKEGWEVICVDNLCSGKLQNIYHLRKNKKFTFVEQDISKPFTVNKSIDLILHFASRASPMDYQEHSIETLMSNSFGTYHLLNLAKLHNCKMVYASTSEIYGNPLVHPQPETYWGNVNPIGPRSCYDESKRFGESLCLQFYRKFGVNVRIVRIFNTYGPRMRKDDGRVISNFINQALRNHPLTVYGDGKQTRSFCYVSDLVEGVYEFANSKHVGEIINLGNTEEYTVLDLAKKIIEMTGSESELVHKPLPPDDPVRRRPDISKAKNLLDWEPKISFEEGLKRTINYFRGMI